MARHTTRSKGSPWSRVAVAGISVFVLFGCAISEPVVVAPLPEPAGFLERPLPGVDDSVIEDVTDNFDSTFVIAEAELQARRDYLEGTLLFERVDSLLTGLVGPSALPDFDAHSEAGSSAEFDEVRNEARGVLERAARAQLSEDSLLASSLLGQAQELFERALSMNPMHEEARYELAQVYRIRAASFKQAGAWEQLLAILRELVKLRANAHTFWAEMAIALDNLGRPAASALTWRQAAQVVLDDSRLAFEASPPPVDSASLFFYNHQAYRMFVRSRDGEGVRRSLADAWDYARTAEERDFAVRELIWAQWDYHSFGNRLTFDSLRAAAQQDPLGARDGLAALIGALVRPSARLEASYNHALLSYDNGFEDPALDTLQALWHAVTALEGPGDAPATPGRRRSFATAVDSLAMDPLPYAEFREDLRAAYATFLMERAYAHIQSGASALAFTYLLQVTELGSEYTGRAYVEALRLSRYNPEQALRLEPRIEAVFSGLEIQDQLDYLMQMGNLYRRLGQNEKVASFLERYRALQDSIPE